MIRITYTLTEAGVNFRIDGHADTGMKPDPLCAAVSAYALLLREVDVNDSNHGLIFRFVNGHADVTVPYRHADTAESVRLALARLAASYPDNIQLTHRKDCG